MNLENKLEKLERDTRIRRRCTCKVPQIQHGEPKPGEVDEPCDYCRRTGRIMRIIDVPPTNVVREVML